MFFFSVYIIDTTKYKYRVKGIYMLYHLDTRNFGYTNLIDLMKKEIDCTLKESRRKASIDKSSFKKKDSKFVYKAHAVGLEKDDIDITLKNNILSVKTKDTDTNKFKSIIDHKYKLDTSDLTIDEEKSFAKIDKGVLTIELPILYKQENSCKISFI